MRIGILTKVFTIELVDAAIAKHSRAEQRRRLLPARLVCGSAPWTAPSSISLIVPELLAQTPGNK
ncbi:transposase domain-containing protein [Streptomyces sp. NPDC058874]|uniref:transposase domain-containing protein n=1 Tax=unclassified Streptomyces TaxID=2593676 RepID=UPI0036AF658B